MSKPFCENIPHVMREVLVYLYAGWVLIREWRSLSPRDEFQDQLDLEWQATADD